MQLKTNGHRPSSHPSRRTVSKLATISPCSHRKATAFNAALTLLFSPLQQGGEWSSGARGEVEEGCPIFALTLINIKIYQILFQQNIPNHLLKMTETRKAADVFQKSKASKTATLSHLEQQVGGALVEAISHLDAESKKLAGGIYITKAQEHTFQKDKSFILIHLNYRSNKLLLTPIYKKLVTELEKKLKKTVLILSTRNIQSRWIKENKTQTRPNSRTLTAVYSAVLDELLLPGVIIGLRTRVRLDGTTFSKVVLDKTEQHFLEERVDAIKVAYKNLAHRDIEIEFQKEATYYTLKKGDRR